MYGVGMTITTEPSTTSDLVVHDAPTVFELPGYNLGEFVKRVERANRRLQRVGGSERFEFTFEHFDREKREPTMSYHIDGTTRPTGIYEPWVRATLVNDSLRLQAGDHTFVATLIAEEAGYTVHTAPGQSLDGWARPALDDIHCDVCNTIRRRLNLYIVRNNDTGALVQVGSNCLAPLLGFSPKSLWALTWTDDLVDLTEDDGEERGGWGSRGGDRTVDIDRILAVAWAVSNGGRKYVSVRVADEHPGMTATSGQVRCHIFNPPNSYTKAEERAAYYALDEQARTAQDDEALMAALKACVEAVKEATDYGDNLRTILASESGRCTYRNIGILASLVAVYARENDLREQRRAAAQTVASGFLGEVGTRLRNLRFTVSTVRQFDTDFGTSTLLIGRTDDQHVVKWFASGSHDYEAGDVVKLSAATVKEQAPVGTDKYTQADTTVLTRGKIDDFDERAKRCAEEIAKHGESVENAMDRWLGSKAEKKRFAQEYKNTYPTVAI